MKSKYPWSITLILIIFFTSCSKKNTVSYLGNGVEKMEAGDFSGAIKDLTEVLEQRSDSSTALALRAYCYFQLDSFRRSIDDYDHFIRFEPRMSRSYYYRGMCKNSINDNEGAFRDFDMSVKLCTNMMDYNSLSITIKSELGESYFARGFCLRLLSRFEEAILDFDKAIELQPENPNAYNERGRCYGSLGNHVQAISDCSKAIEIDPSFGDPYVRIGAAHYWMNNYNEGLKNFEKAIELDAFCDIAYYYRGMCKFKLGISGGCEDLKKAYQLGFIDAAEDIEELCPDANTGLDLAA